MRANRTPQIRPRVSSVDVAHAHQSLDRPPSSYEAAPKCSTDRQPFRTSRRPVTSRVAAPGGRHVGRRAGRRWRRCPNRIVRPTGNTRSKAARTTIWPASLAFRPPRWERASCAHAAAFAGSWRTRPRPPTNCVSARPHPLPEASRPERTAMTGGTDDKAFEQDPAEANFGPDPCARRHDRRLSEAMATRTADGSEGTAFIAGVFFDFMAIGQDRVEVPGEGKDRAHLYVARFGGDGQARWLRSFGPLAPSRAVSFVSDKNQIMVAGVVNEPLEDRRDTLSRPAESGVRPGAVLHLVRSGRTHAKRDAPGGGDRGSRRCNCVGSARAAWR